MSEEKRIPVIIDTDPGIDDAGAIFWVLANRDKFEHPVLIGRNILTGRALVDTALSNTLY